MTHFEHVSDVKVIQVGLMTYIVGIFMIIIITSIDKLVKCFKQPPKVDASYAELDQMVLKDAA